MYPNPRSVFFDFSEIKTGQQWFKYYVLGVAYHDTTIEWFGKDVFSKLRQNEFRLENKNCKKRIITSQRIIKNVKIL